MIVAIIVLVVTDIYVKLGHDYWNFSVVGDPSLERGVCSRSQLFAVFFDSGGCFLNFIVRELFICVSSCRGAIFRISSSLALRILVTVIVWA